VLYGSDAVAGVVHVITRGGRNPGGFLAADGGSHGTVDLRGEWSGRAGPVTVGAGASRMRTDGIYPFNSDYANMVVHGRARVTPDDRTEVLVALRSQESDFHYPTDGTGSLVDSNALQRRSGRSGTVEIGRRLTPILEARARVAMREGDFAIDDRPDHAGDLESLLLSREVSRRSADLRLHAVLPQVAVTVGVELERQAEHSAAAWDGAFGPGGDAFDGSRTNRGYYAEVQAAAGRTGLTAGGRLDRNALFGTFVSYRTGAWVMPLPGVRLRAATSRGFKEPTFSEQLADSPYETGNAELRPERATGWEIGVEVSSPRGRWRVQGTAFTQRFRDLIQYAFTFGAPPGTSTYFNVAAADASGVEIEVRAMPVPWLVLDGGYTLLATEVVDAGLDADGAAFVTGERLLRRPAHAFALGARGALDRIAVSGRVRYVGSRGDRDFSTYPASPVVLDGYAVADLGGEVTVLGRRSGGRSLAVGVRIENAFDTDYQEAYGFAAPGRRVFAEVRVRY
jgi:vitamin B12 transporter